MALALVAVAVLVWFAWPLLSPGAAGDGGGAGDAVAGGGGDGADALDDDQLALVEAFDAYEPADCRPTTGEPFAGQDVGVACAHADQAPTRVVFRRFGSTDARDAALDRLAAGAGGGDCRDDRRADHPYTGADGEGRVVCAVSSTVAGLSWSVPGEAVMGSARLDDPDRAADLYDWWADLVERSDG